MGKHIHGHIFQSVVQPNKFAINTFINKYTKCGSVMDTLQVFDNHLKRDVVPGEHMPNMAMSKEAIQCNQDSNDFGYKL